MSIAKPHPSRRSIASHKYDEEQDSLALNKRINLRYNELQYFRNVAQGRYKTLPLLSPSCCRFSDEALQCINNIALIQSSTVPYHSNTQQFMADALMRISNTRSAKFLERLERAAKAPEYGMSLDTVSFGSSSSGGTASLASTRRRPTDFETKLHAYVQDQSRSQYIKHLGGIMQNEVPLPVMSIVYKEVLPILNGMFQDYKKLLSNKPTEHFMTDDAKKQSNEVAACIDALTPS